MLGQSLLRMFGMRIVTSAATWTYSAFLANMDRGLLPGFSAYFGFPRTVALRAGTVFSRSVLTGA